MHDTRRRDTGRLTPRGRAALVGVVFVAWAVTRAGVGDEIVNTGGWSVFTEFWRSMVDPDLGTTFVRLTLDATAITAAYAVLGTFTTVVLGAIGALALSERLWGRTPRWHLTRVLFVVPRAVHEVIWALLLLEVFAFDPLVAIIAIGIPFGAVTAKVFAETIDEADPAPYLALRASGAGRLTSLWYGLLPDAAGELGSYAFYRLECSIRSAAVLGVIGAGGLGFQLDLSFETLRWSEIWTLIAALMALSGIAELWSSAVRRARTPAVGRWSGLVAVALVPLSWRWVGLDLSSIWSERTRRAAVDIVDDLVPPRLGLGGWSELVDASIDTVAMSVLATAIAAAGALVLGSLGARRVGRTARPSLPGVVVRTALRLSLLLFRAVPAPVWAFLAVLVLFPGIWPGAVALGVHNIGVLGRLFAETFEERDTRVSDTLVAAGASGSQVFAYGTLPGAAPRLLALALYRWEVIVRETVIVGVVGAGGLGQLIRDHLAARDFAAISGAVLAVIVISMAIDSISGLVRRSVR